MTKTSELTDQEFQASAWIDGGKEANIWRAGDLTVSPKSWGKLGTEASICNPQRQEAEAEESPAAVGQLVEAAGTNYKSQSVSNKVKDQNPHPRFFSEFHTRSGALTHLPRAPILHTHTPENMQITLGVNGVKKKKQEREKCNIHVNYCSRH